MCCLRFFAFLSRCSFFSWHLFSQSCPSLSISPLPGLLFLHHLDSPCHTLANYIPGPKPLPPSCLPSSALLTTPPVPLTAPYQSLTGYSGNGSSILSEPLLTGTRAASFSGRLPSSGGSMTCPFPPGLRKYPQDSSSSSSGIGSGAGGLGGIGTRAFSSSSTSLGSASSQTKALLASLGAEALLLSNTLRQRRLLNAASMQSNGRSASSSPATSPTSATHSSNSSSSAASPSPSPLTSPSPSTASASSTSNASPFPSLSLSSLGLKGSSGNGGGNGGGEGGGRSVKFSVSSMGLYKEARPKPLRKAASSEAE
ncbi:uncharacterized protein DDB_G0271670-like [Engraulis encrasicolus]|uniref:uncharacterized protein DDB_G0271670-like n=1 Tax=Engraulis encrasicolus TaxID=184585 RepID=UPI002FD5940E